MLSNTAKKWLKASAALIAAGLLTFSLTACAAGFRIGEILLGKYIDSTYELTESFSDIEINGDTADIIFVKSEDGKAKVVCHERESDTATVAVEGGTLKIDADSDEKWYDQIFIGSECAITVYLPAGGYGALKVDGGTGDMSVSSDFGFSGIDIDITTGDITLEASSSGDVKIDVSTGDVKVSGISAGVLEILSSTGDVEVSDADCGSINVKGTTGKATFKNVKVSGAMHVVGGQL